LREATDIVNADRRAAAALWIADSNSKLALDKVEAILTGPKVRWTVTPEQTMTFARFMFRVGSLKQEPESWRDFFFPEIHDVPGG
jgi:NitT/TauT family transport system substrate-binding protein